jgi:hypothetical protein
VSVCVSVVGVVFLKFFSLVARCLSRFLFSLTESEFIIGRKREFEGFHIDSNLWRVFTVYAVHRLKERKRERLY